MKLLSWIYPIDDQERIPKNLNIFASFFNREKQEIFDGQKFSPVICTPPQPHFDVKGMRLSQVKHSTTNPLQAPAFEEAPSKELTT